MSRHPDAESTSSRSRPRAHTTSFPTFPWQRPRQEHQPAPAPTLPPPRPPQLSLEALIGVLSSSAVPGLTHARALASAISTCSPLPHRAALNPIVASLCDSNSPLALQAAGFEILAGYFEHNEAQALLTSDRLSYFSLFLEPSIPWAAELWEPRFKALRAMSKYGLDIMGIEAHFLDVLKSWVEGAFEGLTKVDNAMDRLERSERERSVEVVASFITQVVEIPEVVARISEEELSSVSTFYSNLVDRSIVLNIDQESQERLVSNVVGFQGYHLDMRQQRPLPPQSLVSSPAGANRQASSRPTSSHRRNPSSLSASSSIPPSPASIRAVNKHPAEVSIPLYLSYLALQLRVSSPSYLGDILPVLFRLLAFCSSPLHPLSLNLAGPKRNCFEEQINENLTNLFTGPYASSCMLLLKKYLSPLPVNVDDFFNPELGHASGSGSFNATPTNAPALPKSLKLSFLTARGAIRTLRNHIRRTLFTRLARSYIMNETSRSYSHSGVPGHMNVERELMERAWPRDDYIGASGLAGGTGWDAGRLGKVLADSAEAWVLWSSGWNPSFTGSTSVGGMVSWKNANGEERWALDKEREEKELVLGEFLSIVVDLLQQLDAETGEDEPARLDEEEAIAIQDILSKLVTYVLPLRNADGTPFILPLDCPTSAPTPFLRALAGAVGNDWLPYINHLLPSILIEITDNLSDPHTSRICSTMAEQHDLSPTSPEWLENWGKLLGNFGLLSLQRQLTRNSVLGALDMVYESVRDMHIYRRPLADLIWEFCNNWVTENEPDANENADSLWRVMGEEIVLRAAEHEGEDDDQGDANEEDEGDEGMGIAKYIALLVRVSSEFAVEDLDDDDGDTISIRTMDTHSQSPNLTFNAPSTLITQMRGSFQGREREREPNSAIPSVMSILSSLTSGNASRSRLEQLQPADGPPERSISPEPLEAPTPSLPRCIAATSALIGVFTQLAFTPFILQASNLRLSTKIYETLVSILLEGNSPRVRVAILQFLLRLRSDRDHKIYYSQVAFDTEGHAAMLASLLNRASDNSTPTAGAQLEESLGDGPSEALRARPRVPYERDGRQVSRARGGVISNSSRSRSRAAAQGPSPPVHPLVQRPRDPLWHIPEALPFVISHVDSPSEALVTYDTSRTNTQDLVPLLPVSMYLEAIIKLLQIERNWEIVTYILCHLPNQLANKHFFCGPKARSKISQLLNLICSGLLKQVFGSQLDRIPSPYKVRDAQDLAFHSLSVLVSYRRCFDLQQRHVLVETFQLGLNGQLPTIKCCLHALSLAAFDLQPSITRCLPRIMEKLSQIMSNPNMSVHILAFLSIVGSLPPLYANFTEGDYKVVFGVALRYLQHYNRLNSSPTISWALSQHVRILSYYVVYVWFLALRLSDRATHIPYITRQLLLANEGNTRIDDATEVCFDWLARYTYASADPRPATSVFSEIIMNTAANSEKDSLEPAVNEKTWIAGSAIITMRALARLGWVEVLIRRPSGFSKFLCHAENAPMVGPGDVDPDKVSVLLGLLIGRDPHVVPRPEDDESSDDPPLQRPKIHENIEQIFKHSENTEDGNSRPDSMTGYVWSRSAPSQRRKEVTLYPSYLALQFSSYPNLHHRNMQVVDKEQKELTRFFNNLDRQPVIDTHKVGIMYVAPGQTNEVDILRNTHGSPAYTRFLEGLGRLINLRGQLDVYAGGLDPDEDGEYAYAWWDDIGQILYHTATMMPNNPSDPALNSKKRHIGNDYVRIVWNDSGKPYKFDTLTTQFQFVNIVIEPHSLGAIAAFSNSIHENEYFKVTMQQAPGMMEFTPIGHYKLISAESLPLLVRQLSLLADWFASVFSMTKRDTARVEFKTNWQNRLETIRRFKNQSHPENYEPAEDIMGEELARDFTTMY